MNLAKLSKNGQITVPLEVRRALNLKTGDKVLFVKNREGQMTIGNASDQRIYEAQTAFEGVAERLNLKDEEGVQKLVDEVRYDI